MSKFQHLLVDIFKNLKSLHVLIYKAFTKHLKIKSPTTNCTISVSFQDRRFRPLSQPCKKCFVISNEVRNLRWSGTLTLPKKCLKHKYYTHLRTFCQYFLRNFVLFHKKGFEFHFFAFKTNNLTSNFTKFVHFSAKKWRFLIFY